MQVDLGSKMDSKESLNSNIKAHDFAGSFSKIKCNN
jgi:hypothetical protein